MIHVDELDKNPLRYSAKRARTFALARFILCGAAGNRTRFGVPIRGSETALTCRLT